MSSMYSCRGGREEKGQARKRGSIAQQPFSSSHLHVAIPGVDTVVPHEKGAVELSTKVDFRHKSSLLFRLHGVPHELRLKLGIRLKTGPRTE
jgi:hypothetical protein